MPLAFKGRTGSVTAEAFAEDAYQERRINMPESSLSKKEMKKYGGWDGRMDGRTQAQVNLKKTCLAVVLIYALLVLGFYFLAGDQLR